MALGLVAYEAGVGPCGFHHSLTADKGNIFEPVEDDGCAVCAAQPQYARIQGERDDKWRAQFPDSKPPAAMKYPWDGRRTMWRMRSPLDMLLGSVKAAAALSAPEPHDQHHSPDGATGKHHQP